jgi:1-acyl-sn-glycerol-3-phosphate acyltransferase
MSGSSWQYEPAADLDQTLLERLHRFPRQADMLVYGLRLLAAVVLRVWLRLYHRLSIVGLDNLPPQGSFVMVANHASHLDALCLLSALPLSRLHHAFPVAAQDYFFDNLRKAAFAAILVNALPFGRHARKRQSLDLCRCILAIPGNILILFPEGTRTTTGELGEFRPGVGSLVAGTAVPIIPCALQGTFDAWPKGRIIPRPRRIRLIIGPARAYAGLAPGHEMNHRVAEELRRLVHGLSRTER